MRRIFGARQTRKTPPGEPSIFTRLYNTGMTQICIVPKVDGVGGMASFRLKLEAGLRKRGIRITHDPREKGSDAVLVVAGTRHIDGILHARRRGVPIVHRLDGINWMHRARFTNLRHAWRSETGNLLLAFTRRFLADRVIYQSAFVQQWWEAWYGPTRTPHTVIYNGVDLEAYSPHGPAARPSDRYRMLLVEGDLTSGQHIGLTNAVRLAEGLTRQHGLPVEIAVAAKVNDAIRAAWQGKTDIPIQFLGVLPRERIPETDRSAHLFFSAEVNSACPNAVIEALACGLPVVGFDTGALKEIVTDAAGVIAPYGNWSRLRWLPWLRLLRRCCATCRATRRARVSALKRRLDWMQW